MSKFAFLSSLLLEVCLLHIYFFMSMICCLTVCLRGRGVECNVHEYDTEQMLVV